MKLNPFSNSNPMSWQDAAKVAAILSLATYFTAFLIPYQLDDITGALQVFAFETLKFYCTAFFTNFIALAGLAKFLGGKTDAETAPSTKKV